MSQVQTHNKTLGYLAWLLGFIGLHRFYFGRPVTGAIWFFTAGLLLVGWIIDLFLIPRMQREAVAWYHTGRHDYTVAWLLLVLLGVFGAHRFYLGKWITGLLFLCTGGLFGIGLLYDLCTLNAQIDYANTVA